MRTQSQNPEQASPASFAAPGSRWLVNARTAGVLYLAIIILGLFSEVARRSRLVEQGDPARTAENILGAEWLFRAVFTAGLALILCEVALVVMLYLLLRPVSGPVSLLAAAFRLISLAIYGLNLLNLLAALHILRDAPYLDESGADRPDALALLFLDLQHYGYAIGLTFFAMNCLAMGYLLVKSSHVRTALGVMMGIAGLCYLTNSFMDFLIPGYDGSLTAVLLFPAFVAESWFCLTLLRKGGGLRGTEPA